jgi:hypothetical protein
MLLPPMAMAHTSPFAAAYLAIARVYCSLIHHALSWLGFKDLSLWAGAMNSSHFDTSKCPLGTSWFECYNKFIGCCSVDPCVRPGKICPSGSDSPTPTRGTSISSFLDCHTCRRNQSDLSPSLSLPTCKGGLDINHQYCLLIIHGSSYFGNAALPMALFLAFRELS